MSNLQEQAFSYAEDRLKHYPDITIWKVDVRNLIADAYEQGWVDRDTKDMKPESESEFFNNKES